MNRRSSAEPFPSHVLLTLRVTTEQVVAEWQQGANSYRVSGKRSLLEQGDVSSLRIDRQLADAYTGQLPQAFEAHLLPTMCAQVIDAARRHRGTGDHEYERSVALDLTTET